MFGQKLGKVLDMVLGMVPSKVLGDLGKIDFRRPLQTPMPRQQGFGEASTRFW